MKVRTQLGILLLAHSGYVLAIEPSQCISLRSRGTGGVELLNTCDRKLNVTYCVDNPKSSFACSKGGTGFGMKTLSPGNKEFIPFYSSDGGGRVYWAACVYPDGAAGWTGPGDRFSCR